MSDQPTLVDRYFISWRNHDVASLKTLFADGATYQITNKDPIEGIRNIESYWSRNRKRQRQLSITYDTLDPIEGRDRAIFQASFFDSEEKEFQIVSGIVCFELTSDRTLIRHLAETYIKTARPEQKRTPTFKARIHQVTRTVVRQLSHTGSAVGSFLVGSAAVILILCIGLLIFLHQSTPPQWVVELSLWLFAPPQAGVSSSVLDAALSRSREVTALGISLLIGVGVPLVTAWRTYRRSERRSIRTENLDYAGHDLQIMNRVYEGADSVVVFSGDFSFLREHEALREKIVQLAQEKKITMISYKSHLDVCRQLGKEAGARDLFEQIEAQQAIYYDVPLVIKCSLVSHRARRQILYKYRTPGVGEDEIMCIFTETEESRYLVDALDKVFTYIRSTCVQQGSGAAPASAQARISLPKLVVVLTGPPASGKTSCANFLAAFGFRVVSASALLRRPLFQDDSGSIDRKQLVEKGYEIVQQNGPVWFAKQVLNEASGHDAVVLDGIRPVESIEYIHSAVERSLVIYIESDAAVCMSRMPCSSEYENVDYTELMAHPLEREAALARDIADCVISNNSARANMYRSLVTAISSHT